ncbi:uncharacterized protein DS421_7g218880 [Arachis hypogaea]|nr:uncharacterized protein DS421_7g218880 [Arachis hypogaea]
MVMACQAGHDGNINILNETSHYAGAADFERPRLLLPRRVSHTLPPPNAIVPYLAEAEFGDTVPLRDFTFDNFLISALVERWRPETHTFHLLWGEVVQHGDVGHGGAAPWCQSSGGGTTGGADEGIVHAEADKSNNMVRVRWLLLLWDFAECRTLSWGSGVLAWTYQSLCLVAQRGITDIASCTPLLMSWIYQRFSQWCPPNRGVYQYPLATRLVGLQQQSRDQHQVRVLYYRVSIDQLRFDEFAWRVYDDLALQALCPHWLCEEKEQGTWLLAVSIVCFNIVRFHQVDRVKRQFNGEQPVPGIPVNLDRYLTTTGHGEDVWWPERLQQWYDGWRQRFEPGPRITVHHTFDTRPTGKYYDWWRGTCRVRHLSGQEVLEELRLVEFPPKVQLTTSQPRDDLTLLRGVPDRRRRARKVREDTRRPARREQR